MVRRYDRAPALIRAFWGGGEYLERPRVELVHPGTRTPRNASATSYLELAAALLPRAELFVVGVGSFETRSGRPGCQRSTPVSRRACTTTVCCSMGPRCAASSGHCPKVISAWYWPPGLPTYRSGAAGTRCRASARCWPTCCCRPRWSGSTGIAACPVCRRRSVRSRCTTGCRTTSRS